MNRRPWRRRTAEIGGVVRNQVITVILGVFAGYAESKIAGCDAQRRIPAERDTVVADEVQVVRRSQSEGDVSADGQFASERHIPNH